ncbi:hypothetical protein San01_38910 [Streptomyces angustmyceticus]|uniref:Uncharacterized protein n=1 Tax=Streptomyces angustmyceticus TaxID=285578 RepID=A0A5J4LFW1_9ACTN|nr:hypothetical protein San01_38910 [Streptomyces angustmyceticus]
MPCSGWSRSWGRAGGTAAVGTHCNDFRSPWAAALPLLTAVAGVGAGGLGTGLLSGTTALEMRYLQ